MSSGIALQRSRLHAELQALDLRLRALDTPAPDVHGDDADQMTARQGQEDLVVERARLMEKRALCLAALIRIEERSYFNCVECLEPISEPRLHAIPWAQRCLSCESRAESSALRRAGDARPLDMTPGDEAHE